MNQTDKTNHIIYQEKIISSRTQFLFAALMLIFALLMNRRFGTTGMDPLAWGFLFLTLIFLFYSLNYRKLEITITPESLALKFGLFSWTETKANIDAAALDELPWLMRNGGAGIHFMMIDKRYRISFNFLEYPRVAVRLKRKRGLVQDISFTTQNPQEVLRALGGG